MDNEDNEVYRVVWGNATTIRQANDYVREREAELERHQEVNNAVAYITRRQLFAYKIPTLFEEAEGGNISLESFIRKLSDYIPHKDIIQEITAYDQLLRKINEDICLNYPERLKKFLFFSKEGIDEFISRYLTLQEKAQEIFNHIDDIMDCRAIGRGDHSDTSGE